MIITDRKQFGYPVRHKKKVPFDPKMSLSKEVMELNTDIFRMESELDRCILSGNDLEELITDAFTSNIHLSTSMEGNPLSEEEVSRLTRRTFREGPPSKKVGFFSQEVFNHIFAYISGSYSDIWNLDTIFTTHGILMYGDESAEPGTFRKGRGVVETDEGEEVFIPCPPEHIEDEMVSLITWLNTKANALFPVVAASVFFHEFESIHPFKDGNGRTGRALFHVLLQNRGLPNSKLCLVEKEIVSDLRSYYDLLARTDFSGDHSQLITDFTKGVWRSYRVAVEKFRKKDLLRSDLDEISKRLVMGSKKNEGSFKLKEARDWVPDESEYVLRQRLNELVDRGILRSYGKTKGKVYLFYDPIVEWVMNNSSEIFSLVR